MTFLKIYEDGANPWSQDYYMCGMCGHAIAAKETTRHAKIAHHADSLRLLEVDDTELTPEESAQLQRDGLIPTGNVANSSGGSDSLTTSDN